MPFLSVILEEDSGQWLVIEGHKTHARCHTEPEANLVRDAIDRARP